MTDEGYLQTKIRELQNKNEQLEQSIDSLKLVSEKNKMLIEEKEKSIQSSIIKMNELLAKIDSPNLESSIKDKTRIAIEQNINKVIDKTRIELDSWAKGFQEKTNQTINTVESDLGTKIMNHQASLIQGIANMLFSITK